MRYVLRQRERGELEFGIIYGGIALLAILAGRFLPVLAAAPSCVFRSLTGLPCPTCGSTRSIVHLSQGDVVQAFAMNPLTAACAFGAVIYLFYAVLSLVFDLPRIKLVFTEKEKDGIRVAAVLTFVLNWVYLFFSL